MLNHMETLAVEFVNFVEFEPLIGVKRAESANGLGRKRTTVYQEKNAASNA